MTAFTTVDIPDHLPAASWISWPACRQLMAALQGRGRFVGGAVRDTLLSRPVNDIDLTTPWHPDQTMALLQQAGIKVIPTGIDHGTVTAVIDHHGFEVTTLRRDVESHGRHATVAFTDDWAEDAARRDLTINALYADGDGVVFDPVGGLNDLRAGHVRFIGAADQRIREDYLRLLRFFRFHAWYGRGPVDGDALEACTRLAAGLDILSVERVWIELRKLLAAPDPLVSLRPMVDHHILPHLLPEAGPVTPDHDAHWLDSLRRLPGSAGPLLRLAGLLPDADSAVRAADRLRLSNAERASLVALLSVAAEFKTIVAHPWPALRRYGRAAVRDGALLATARGQGESAEFLDRIGGWHPRPLPISGTRLQSLGVKPGPALGDLIRRLRDWWDEAGQTPDEAACFAQAKFFLSQESS